MRKWILIFLLVLAACMPAVPQVPVAAPQRSEAPPIQSFQVNVYPAERQYVGDRISFEVLAPDRPDRDALQVQLRMGDRQLGSSGFWPRSLSQLMHAPFPFAWDTSNLEAGEYSVTVSVSPGDLVWQETITLLPDTSLPEAEASASWAESTSDCCTYYYITGTEAGRDLQYLVATAEQEAASVSQRMGASFKNSIPIVFLPRTLGHGGFASSRLYVSYLDRNYAGSSTVQVLRHEMVHWLDRQLGGDFLPSLFVEGVAVYVSGGHFKEEPLVKRAAALLDLGWYIPLDELADGFYFHPHEVSYLQAGALTAFLVETHGWQAFSDFYRSIRNDDNQPQSQAIDRALQEHFGISLEQLDQQFRAYLQLQKYTEGHREDLRLTVRFYDTVRRYQLAYDPSAYFLTAWLPDDEYMRKAGIIADYLRHPDSAFNRYVEAMLVDADRDLRAGRYSQVELTLEMVDAVMSAAEWFQLNQH